MSEATAHISEVASTRSVVYENDWTGQRYKFTDFGGLTVGIHALTDDGEWCEFDCYTRMERPDAIGDANQFRAETRRILVDRIQSDERYRVTAPTEEELLYGLVGSKCEDCGGSGTVDELPEDEPVYWSDIADGTYSVPCPTCDGTGSLR